MNYHLLSVSRTGVAANIVPKIQIFGDWLTEMGFVSGSLVQALPEPNGFVFNLFNENVDYSDLFNSTKEQGGSLIRIFVGSSYADTFFATTGKYIYSSGLKIGDALVAKYEFGRIRMRKISENVRLIHVARLKHENPAEPKPYVLLSGAWLNGIGFTPDTLVSIAGESCWMTLTAYDKEIIYRDIARLARQNKMRLVQVSNKCGNPFIKITGAIIERSGFGLGDIFVAEYEHGSIKLQKFDPQRFGFPEIASCGD